MLEQLLHGNQDLMLFSVRYRLVHNSKNLSGDGSHHNIAPLGLVVCKSVQGEHQDRVKNQLVLGRLFVLVEEMLQLLFARLV